MPAFAAAAKPRLRPRLNTSTSPRARSASTDPSSLPSSITSTRAKGSDCARSAGRFCRSRASPLKLGMMAIVALTLLQTTAPASDAADRTGQSPPPLPVRRRFFNRDAPAGLLAAAIALHVVAALGFLFALPLYDWPDEPAHLNYVRRLAAGSGFGMMRPDVWHVEELETLKRTHFRDADSAPARAVIDRLAYEAHQPPLYYLLAAAIYRPTASATAVKLLNLFLSCVATVLAWAAARRLYPDDGRVAVAAAFLLALVPTRCFMAVSVGNDLLAEVLFGLFVLAVLRGARPSVVGALIGVGLLAKASALLALPLYAVWPARRTGCRDALSRLAVAAAVALAVASPWLARNVLTYGWSDPFALWSGALARPAAVPGGSLPHLVWSGPTGVWNFLLVLFASWWGVFGWMGMLPGRETLGLYGLLSLAPLAGGAGSLVRTRLHASRADTTSSGADSIEHRAALRWVALAPLLVFAGLVLYSLHDFQPQGRYLMVASSCLGVLWAAGSRAAFGRRLTAWIAASALALAWANAHAVAHVIPWYLAR